VTVLLVRHAVAADRHHWAGDDDDRPLTGRGRAQAEALVEQLRPLHPTDVSSSPSLRCVDTVSPLATAAGLALHHAEALAEGNGEAAADLVKSLLRAPGTAVLCTHGDVIPEVLDALGVDPGGRCQKGSTWVLEAGQDGRAEGRYLPPPA
jgi:phosphohistidine phosphatase SixA